MEPEFEINYGKNELTGNYANINGIQMYYEVYGKGHPLLIIHGNGSSIAGMGYQIDYFKSRYMVVAADSRGHGRSELKTGHLTYKQMAEDWLSLINFLGLKNVNIIGWSDGGIIGIYMTMLQGGKISKLVTMGTNVKPHQSTNKMDGFLVNVALKEAEMKIHNRINIAYWTRKQQHLQLLKEQPDIHLDDLNKIKCHTLILAGENDSVKELHTHEIAANIPGAKCKIFPGEDHFMPVSNPEVFNRIVEEFLEDKN